MLSPFRSASSIGQCNRVHPMGLGHLGLAGLPLGLDGLQHRLELGTVPGSALVHLVYPSLRKLARLLRAP